MFRALTLLALVLLAPAARAQAPADLVRAELLAEPASLRPGEPFTVGVRLTMKPHWHTYWRNPGDSGLATEIAWDLPKGFSAGPIEWPAPARIPVAHLVNYAYEGTTTLLTRITPPADLKPGEAVPLKAKVSYLVCERECIPGEAELALSLPTGTAAASDPANAKTFTQARAALPVAAPWPATAGTDGDALTLRVAVSGLRAEAIRSATFFPYGETVLTHAAPQALSVDAQGITLRLTRSAEASGPPPSRLNGVLAIEETTGDGVLRQAFALGEEPLLPSASPAAAPPFTGGAPASEATSLWQAALLALAGGLILNLMPCVFPVLSIKVLSLVRQAGERPGRVRLHGLAYTAGVLATFLALAGALIGLKGGGAEIGWGFQLQSPLVVAALAYVLFAVGLSLSGVVEVGGGISGLGDGLTRRAGLEGSFFTGVLATVVATPCTAPFMGTAVGYALTQSPVVALTVFAALGLGLALPFLVLTVRPSLVRALPRPGAWMETLKQALAFPVYATAAWLVWVLAQQVGPSGLLMALMGLVLVGFSAWAYAKGRGAPRPFAARLGTGLAAAALLAALGLAVAAEGDRPAQGAALAADAEGIQPYTQARLEAVRAGGRPAFVDMTAAWCLTCIVNEKGVLASSAVKAAFAERNVAYLKGDWTNRNPEITALLARHGRSGVPLYVLYPPQGEGTVLPQILTEAMVVEAVKGLGSGDGRRAERVDPSRPTSQE